MKKTSYSRGKEFEGEVEKHLTLLKRLFPSRVDLRSQDPVPLNDGRSKVIDFALDYRTASSRHEVAIECQDRDAWSTEILDKILAIRNHSKRNRFWFVYHADGFLTAGAKSLLDRHGILHFSLEEFRTHVAAVAVDLFGSEVGPEQFRAWIQSRPFQNPNPRDDYDPPGDPAMLSGQ